MLHYNACLIVKAITYLHRHNNGSTHSTIRGNLQSLHPSFADYTMFNEVGYINKVTQWCQLSFVISSAFHRFKYRNSYEAIAVILLS